LFVQELPLLGPMLDAFARPPLDAGICYGSLPAEMLLKLPEGERFFRSAFLSQCALRGSRRHRVVTAPFPSLNVFDNDGVGEYVFAQSFPFAEDFLFTLTQPRSDRPFSTSEHIVVLEGDSFFPMPPPPPPVPPGIWAIARAVNCIDHVYGCFSHYSLPPDVERCER